MEPPGRDGEEIALRIERDQRLVEDAWAILVLGADREVGIEERRGLPPEDLELTASATVGGREAVGLRLSRDPAAESVWTAIGAVRPSPSIIPVNARRDSRPALTSAMRPRI